MKFRNVIIVRQVTKNHQEIDWIDVSALKFTNASGILNKLCVCSF